MRYGNVINELGQWRQVYPLDLCNKKSPDFLGCFIAGKTRDVAAL